jgi:transposase
MKPTGSGKSANLPAVMLKTNIPEQNKNTASAKVEVVKIGIDLHAQQVTVAVQLDRSKPKPAVKIPIGDWLDALSELKKKYPNAKFYSCYEAGPCGYHLHRAMEEMSINNLVVAPTQLSGRRKTDKRDATLLLQSLAGYVDGNTHAFSLVTVPSELHEQRRELPRHRAALVKQRKRAIQQGSSLLLRYGIRLEHRWLDPREWTILQKKLNSHQLYLLSDYKQTVAHFNKLIDKIDEKIAELVREMKLRFPKALGALTGLTLTLEVIDWYRFKNHRQVGSYTGLCPSESSSGNTRRQGSIDRHGNPRVRHALVEAVWRLMRYQPNYPIMKKLRESVGRARRKIAVEAARKLAIDLWRINTGRATPEELGLIMA